MELPERLLRKAEVFAETGGDKLRLTGALVPLPLILFLFTLPLVLLVRHESLPLITLTGLETLFLVALGSLVLGLDLILFGDGVALGFVLAHWSRKSSLISPTA